MEEKIKYDFSIVTIDLLQWFQENKRELQWRSNPNPYYVWISEIMLQQTRVEAVKDYFSRFIQTLPGIRDLAQAREERLLKLWEGLGYYNRARNLQKAAIKIMEKYNGELPADYSSLLKLPGIGSYTAGAIASIAYGIAEPAVDGNVLRVAMRLTASYDDITKVKVKKDLEDDIRKFIPKNEPGNFNQALMELGAIICIPKGQPLCKLCPIKKYCKAYLNNITLELPIKTQKKPRKIEEKTIFILEYNKQYAICQRSSKGLLAGLWELPSLEGKKEEKEIRELFTQLGITGYKIEVLQEAKHIFSHIEWHMTGYKIYLSRYTIKQDIQLKEIFGNYIWINRKQLEEKYTLPSAFVAYRYELK